jgi:hypothetical protein
METPYLRPIDASDEEEALGGQVSKVITACAN